MVLSEGIVVEEGAPEELKKKNGLYAHMVVQTEGAGTGDWCEKDFLKLGLSDKSEFVPVSSR